MSYIIPSVRAELGRFVREVVERSTFALPGKRPRMVALAREATIELERRIGLGPGGRIVGWERKARENAGRKSPLEIKVDANRKLLTRLAYPGTRAMQLQTSSASLAVALLDCIEPGVKQQAQMILLDGERVREWLTSLDSDEWIQSPDPFEYASLIGTLPPGAKPRRCLPTKLAGPVRREIKKFEREMLALGHHRRRVFSSIQRFLAPFCAHARTGGVERRWEDLTVDEQASALRGLDVERAWLGATPADDRLWRVDENPAFSGAAYVAWAEIAALEAEFIAEAQESPTEFK